MARTFQGNRVSRAWGTVLAEAVKTVSFRLNSGRRTMTEQRVLYAQNMLNGRPRPGRPLTAVSNPNAPHIRVGRQAHAIDVDTKVGDGEAALQRWLERHGLTVSNPVPGEAWHMEVPELQLRRLAARIRRQRRKAQRRQRRQARMKMSRRGVDFLIREEGVRRYAYNDPAGHATFGVGHLLHRGPVIATDRGRWGTPERPKSMRLVKKVLRRDLQRFERAVREAVEVPLKPHEFDALVALAFNIGDGGFRSSTVVRELNSGHRRAAAHAFLLWDKPSMLRPRREREQRLFLDGVYT